MSRIGQIILGCVFLLLGLIVQVLLIEFGVGFVYMAITNAMGLAQDWKMFIPMAVVFILMNLLTWHEFKKGRRNSTGFGRAFFFIPRGIFLIAYGRDTYAAAEEHVRGFEVQPKDTTHYSEIRNGQ